MGWYGETHDVTWKAKAYWMCIGIGCYQFAKYTLDAILG